ncbi:uncharacterized protein LOC133978033 [Scomber scombrus]|uniref:uncharacterized protein LOC133978033 n=1 Tax=Scomber scombrus TaxID=13677 RepID=UPI002DDC7E49|nr:uncharacterized protein LOC133978033 [Scomber scombrus]
MGSGCSQYSPAYEDAVALVVYQRALGTCVMPDVGIDESLLKFSGVNSNAMLQTYSNELVNSVPGFVTRLGSALGGLTSIPNAVGFGALVISLILEIFIKSSTQTKDDSYTMLKRVFGEEKASGVRDTMSESVTRYRTFINDNQRLLVEIRRLEAMLSIHLTSLKNSLLHDNQMSSRGFKMWVNGASFHVQMRIHEARLNIPAGRGASDYIDSIKITISLYLQDLERLLEKYKTYKISTTQLEADSDCSCPGFGCYCDASNCFIRNTEKNCEIYSNQNPCNGCGMVKAYMNHVFSKYEPISSLRNHFSNINNNINVLIYQQDVFILPSIA